MTLFDPAEGERRKREAIDRVEFNADVRWKAVALEVVRKVAETRQEFTTDRVWAVLEKHHPELESPHEPRALGAVMRRAAKERLIEKTDRHKCTTRPDAHRRPIPVWKSLVGSSAGSEGTSKGRSRAQGLQGGVAPPASAASSEGKWGDGPHVDGERDPESLHPASRLKPRSVPSLFDAEDCLDWGDAA